MPCTGFCCLGMSQCCRELVSQHDHNAGGEACKIHTMLMNYDQTVHINRRRRSSEAKTYEHLLCHVQGQ